MAVIPESALPRALGAAALVAALVAGGTMVRSWLGAASEPSDGGRFAVNLLDEEEWLAVKVDGVKLRDGLPIAELAPGHHRMRAKSPETKRWRCLRFFVGDEGEVIWFRERSDDPCTADFTPALRLPEKKEGGEGCSLPPPEP